MMDLISAFAAGVSTCAVAFMVAQGFWWLAAVNALAAAFNVALVVLP